MYAIWVVPSFLDLQVFPHKATLARPSHRSIVDNIGNQQFLLENPWGKLNNPNHNHNKKIKKKEKQPQQPKSKPQQKTKTSFKKSTTTTIIYTPSLPTKEFFVSHIITFSIYHSKTIVKYISTTHPPIYPLIYPCPPASVVNCLSPSTRKFHSLSSSLS